MPMSAGGFLHWRKERYLIDDAIAVWNGERLSVFGKSDECALYFCGIPFGRPTNLVELKGKRYSGERETPFSEARLSIAGEPLSMDSGEITCIDISQSLDAVVLEFKVAVEDGSGRTRTLTGVVRCRLVNECEPEFADLWM